MKFTHAIGTFANRTKPTHQPKFAKSQSQHNFYDILNFFKIQIVNLANENFDCRRRTRTCTDIVKYLSGQNYVCEVAENYNQATDKIAVYQYDCILLDLMLPDGNGLALLEQLKRENKQDGVIIISAKILLRTK